MKIAFDGRFPCGFPPPLLLLGVSVNSLPLDSTQKHPEEMEVQFAAMPHTDTQHTDSAGGLNPPGQALLT